MWKEAILRKSNNESDGKIVDRNPHLLAVFDTLEDELLIIDRKYRILFADRPLLLRLNQEDNLVTGNNCYAISRGFEAPCHSSDYVCPLEKAWKTGAPVTVMHQHVRDSRGQRDHEVLKHYCFSN